MSRWKAIRLVASREIVERGRSRGYALSLAFTVILMLVGFIIPALLVGNATNTKLAVVGESPAGLEEWLTQTADAYDLEVVLSTLPDRQAAAEGRGTAAEGCGARTVVRRCYWRE